MIDKNKTYQTREGNRVRIYATDGCGMAPVHGAIEGLDGWQSEDWTAEGAFHSVPGMRSAHDLVEAKPRIKQTVWLNLYSNGGTAYPSRDLANCVAKADRIACIRVELDYEVGEGL